MTEQSPRTSKVNYVLREETKSMLEKLAKIHDRSMTGVIEQLIKKEAKEYGLIESRD